MDRQRAELVDHIRMALTASRAVNEEMCTYLLELALTEALALKSQAAETSIEGGMGGVPKKR